MVQGLGFKVGSRVQGLGFSDINRPIMENQMEKKTETGV